MTDTASFPPYLTVEYVRGVGAARWLQVPMFHRFIAVIIALAGLVWTANTAFAHPHVWVRMHSDLLYAPGGSVTAVRQTWTFDDMFSAFATMGFPKTDGTFTRETLQPLAKVNVDSLKDFDYFTYATIDGKQVKDVFNDPLPDYWLDYDAKTTLLTLHFTLPFKTPVKAKSLQIEVYDPTFFIDFAMKKTDPVTLVSAPAHCKVATEKPPDINFPTTLRLDQALVTSEANIGMGASFANKITVTCP
jgi:ABC-type uncharacterized transport system substrate-binding protein